MILVIDNYDSFTYNLVQAFLVLEAEVLVYRNDALTVAEAEKLKPTHLVISPGPGRPDEAGSSLAMIGAFAGRIPVLGVCRGMQVMAVHAGGVLDQHTPDVVGHEQHSPGGDEFGDIRVSTEPNSRLASLIGPEVKVACHHHQSVREAPGFRFTAYAGDGTAEAMEAPDGRFRIGVQWHPEMRTEQALFRGLVEAAAG